MPDLIAGDARVERTAPSAAQNFDRLGRIGAAAERPEKFFRIGDIDVIVNYNDITSQIGARAALTRDHARLARMTRVALRDRNHRQESTACRMAPHAFDV